MIYLSIGFILALYSFYLSMCLGMIPDQKLSLIQSLKNYWKTDSETKLFVHSNMLIILLLWPIVLMILAYLKFFEKNIK